MANPKGSKYIKLRGDEVATPENQRRADLFMKWYGAVFAKCALPYQRSAEFDSDTAGDTALQIYDDIALKGRKIKSYKNYFFLAYTTNYKKRYKTNSEVPLSEAELEEVAKCQAERNKLIHALRSDILEYVRERRPPFDCALFEIYEGLYPDISYARMAEMLGLNVRQIDTSMAETRRIIVRKYSGRYGYLRTL